jgi:hypothetical protein
LAGIDYTRPDDEEGEGDYEDGKLVGHKGLCITN